MGARIYSVVGQLLEWLRLLLMWTLILSVVMPLSTMYDILLRTRNKLIFTLGTAPRAHGRKVAAIQSQVREWSASGHGTKLYPVHTGWLDIFRRPPQKGFTPVYTRVLRDILEVDTGGLRVRVEPMVTMSQLSQVLIPLGYCLPIFPSRPGLTVQDAINGCAVDASGRKYGLFQHICISFELVMPDGSVVVASKERNGDAETQALFYGVPWSEGTLGILVAATLRIILVKPFVKVTYLPTHSTEEMQTKLTEECNCRENEFVEGVQLNRNEGLVLRGRFSEGPPRNFASTINRIGRWYQPWFYSHIEKIASINKEFTEFIPLHDYYHRHTRHLYWEMKAATPSFLSLPRHQNHMHHDLLVPMEHLPEILEVADRDTKIYPLWLCPYNQPSCPGMVRQRSGRNVLFVNVGVYGIPNRPDFDSKVVTRRLEEAVRSVNGVRIMHGDTQMSRSEFWQMFDSSLYEWLRVKYNCKDAFVDVYDKSHQAALY